MVVMHSRMSESGQEALPNVQGWSVDHPECLKVVGSPSWMSGSGRESLSDSRMSESGQDALPDVQEWSGAFPDVRR